MEASILPTVVSFSQDEEFLSILQELVFAIGGRLLSLEDTTEFLVAEPSHAGRVFAEPLAGLEARLIERLSAWQPVLILFDLDNQSIPWKKWVPLIKSVSATRRLPLICTGSVLSISERDYAWELGADGIYAKVLDHKVINEWLQKHARFLDIQTINESCNQPLSVLAVYGLELFNRGEYFEAHEILEEAWNQDHSSGREMYRAILQIAVAYLQIERGNYQGALKMFLRVRQWIQPLPDLCRGVDIAQLRQDAQRVHAQLKRVGKDHLTDFDRSLFKPVKYQENR